MTATIGTTPRGVPIGVWMVEANPDVCDVGTDIADAGTHEVWVWTLAES